MSRELIFIVACLLAAGAASSIRQLETRATHPDAHLTVPELVTKYGYPIEVYEVETEDHYLLTLHHIPHGKDNANSTAARPTIFVMHGALCSSADWVLMGPEKGLAYLLADRGYDVWLGNARGNTYSRKHATLNPDKDAKFWAFSWHEIGIHDLPALIDFVLGKTQSQDLLYVGHSQGTTSFFVMTSERPEYNKKIRAMIAMGPAVYMDHVDNIVLRMIATFYPVVGWVSSMLGQNEFMPSSAFLNTLSDLICDEEFILNGICSNILFLIAGFDKPQLDEAMVPVILGHTPAGISTRQFLHYCQEIISGKFRQYDHGYIDNWEIYGQWNPPDYKIANIEVPVAFFYAKNDLLVSTTDVKRFIPQVKNVIVDHLVEYEDFSHLDFLWATDVVTLLYNTIFDLLETL